MKQQLSAGLLGLLLVSSSYGATLESLEERIIQLEQEKQKNAAQIDRLKRTAVDDEPGIRINGFFNSGIARLKTENEGAFNYSDVTPEWGFESETEAGLQFTAPVNDVADVVVQLYADAKNADDNFNARVEWAYMRYQITDNLMVRAGRLRGPFFAMSEFLDVGYAYPWARLPVDVYQSTLNVNAYNGLDVIYKMRAGPANLEFEAYYGSQFDDGIGFDIELENLGGTRFKAEWGDFSFLAAYAEGRLTATFDDFELGDLEMLLANPTSLAPPGLIDQVPITSALHNVLVEGQGPAGFTLDDAYGFDDIDPAILLATRSKASFSTVGINYNNGIWSVAAEAARLKLEGLSPDHDSHYISLARRFGNWQPYVVYSRVYSVDNAERQKTIDQYNNAAAGVTRLIAEATALSGIPAAQFDALLGLAGVAGVSGADLVAGFAEFADRRSGTRQALAGAVNGINDFVPALESLTGHQKTATAGVRWDFKANMALKFEYQYIYDIKNAPRLVPGDGDTSAGTGDRAEVFTLVLNTVF